MARKARQDPFRSGHLFGVGHVLIDTLVVSVVDVDGGWTFGAHKASEDATESGRTAPSMW